MAQDHWELGRWNRIPVSMHWTVLLGFAWMYLIFWDLLATVIASAALFVVLVAHQFGHAWFLRWKKIRVTGIMLNGIHGETSSDYASPRDAAFVAWGGIFGQVLVLLVGTGISMFVGQSLTALVLLGPVLLVFTKINIFLMVVALLPIGPFDGREAWSAFPLMRASMRKRARKAREPRLTDEQRKDLEAKSQTEAADLLDRLMKKSDKEDA